MLTLLAPQHRQKEVSRNVTVPFKIPHKTSPRRGRHYNRRVYKSLNQDHTPNCNRNLNRVFLPPVSPFLLLPKQEPLRCWRCCTGAPPLLWCHGVTTLITGPFLMKSESMHVDIRSNCCCFLVAKCLLKVNNCPPSLRSVRWSDASSSQQKTNSIKNVTIWFLFLRHCSS